MAASKSIELSFSKIVAILAPYVRSRFFEQLKSVRFIILYLIGFQYLILGLPIVYSATIALGVFIVIIGLMFFMEGLNLGLMPLGEIAGINLPQKAKLRTVLVFAFTLGLLATLAEPAISVLKATGVGLDPQLAPLLYSILNDFPQRLVYSVGAGVGVAVLLGMFRFYYDWSLKWFILPLVIILLGLTLYFHFNPVLSPLIGLAWDCGAVTTGPVTVPLVLAMGIGVCRIVGKGDDSSYGFGVVTLASLAPILTVMLLGSFHYLTGNYYGGKGYTGKFENRIIAKESMPKAGEEQLKAEMEKHGGFTQKEFEKIIKTGKLPKNYELKIDSQQAKLIDGNIIVRQPDFVFTKSKRNLSTYPSKTWNPDFDIFSSLRKAIMDALWAILLLSGFLFLAIKFFLKEKIRNADQIGVGIGFAIIGMAIFSLGIAMGLSPLGKQLGSNISSAFVRIQPWGLQGFQGPIFSNASFGKSIAVVFAFFLGYGATLAEPALNALGASVEKITIGAFKKTLLMQTVAIGVGTGIALGIIKIIFNIPLSYLLLPPYGLLIFLTLISSEEFVNFGWDSAGVTTGPITVPLVLALGLGVGSNHPLVISSFGVLSLASVMPIIAVLFVGLTVSYTNHRNKREQEG